MTPNAQNTIFPILPEGHIPSDDPVTVGNQLTDQLFNQQAILEADLAKAEQVAQALHGMQGFIMQTGTDGLSVIDTETIQVATEALAAALGLDCVRELSFEANADLPLRNRTRMIDGLKYAEEGALQVVKDLVAKAIEFLSTFWARMTDQSRKLKKMNDAVEQSARQSVMREDEVSPTVKVAPTYLRALIQSGAFAGSSATVHAFSTYETIGAAKGNQIKELIAKVDIHYLALLNAASTGNLEAATQAVFAFGEHLSLRKGSNVRLKIAGIPEGMAIEPESKPFGGYELWHWYVADPQTTRENLRFVGTQLRPLGDQAIQVPDEVDRLQAQDIVKVCKSVRRLLTEFEFDSALNGHVAALKRSSQQVSRASLDLESTELGDMVRQATRALVRVFSEGVAQEKVYNTRLCEAMLRLSAASL